MSIFWKIVIISFFLNYTSTYSQKNGCTDPLSKNYDSTATINDGSCLYESASVSPSINWIIPSELSETSGLIFWNNKLWTHVDDTDRNIYSIDTNDVDNLDAFKLNGTSNIDWEEISQDSQYVYIGDFGNNYNGIRKDLKILRIEKNSLLEQKPKIDTINFTYSKQTDFVSKGSNKTDFDCESFIVSKDSIFLFTKEWVSTGTSIYSLPKTPGNYQAQLSDFYDVGGLVTGATFLENERLIVLCGYSTLLQPFLVLLYDFNGNNFFSGNKRIVAFNAAFHQVEGIASIDGINYYLSNEKYSNALITINQKLHKINLKELLGNYLNPLKTSVNYKSYKQIDIRPNPANDKMYIDSNYEISGETYFISNIFGEIIDTGTILSNKNVIDIKSLKNGIYLFTILNNEYYSKKFIKIEL